MINLLLFFFCLLFKQPVGCDLQLNSDLKIDACGICGGDGSMCSTNGTDNGQGQDGQQQRYQWEFSHQLSPCSASCDGGKCSQQAVQSIPFQRLFIILLHKALKEGEGGEGKKKRFQLQKKTSPDRTAHEKRP